jgi:putative intracellular protease/amidase
MKVKFMKCLAIIYDGFEELEAIAPFALLRRANVNLDIASKTNRACGCHNITLDNLIPLSNISYTDYDCLILPGGPHYKELETDDKILNIIKHFMDNNKLTCAICASPTIIGKLGYLKNKNYTCFTALNADFGGTYHHKKVVVDGNLITSRSADAAIDFAYEIIRKTKGEDVLNQVYERVYHEK